MLTLARTAVPVAVAGLLLTACGSSKAGPDPLAAAPDGATAIGVAPGSAGAPTAGMPMGGMPMGGTSTAGTSMGGAGVDAAAPMKAGTPMAAVTPAVAMDAHTITTRGVGKASGTPDTLTILIGVSTQGSNARGTLEANNAKAAALIDLLRRNGVAARDLQTRQLSINPTYNDKSGTISGYQVDNAVQARLRSIAGAGALLDAAAGVAGNAVRVQQIAFSVGDDSALRAQARSQAVSQAKAQAAEIAKAAGVTLGRIRSITELVDAGYPISYDARAAAGASESSVPLQAGQQELTISVDIVYDIG
jgi:hypothetical protein